MSGLIEEIEQVWLYNKWLTAFCYTQIWILPTADWTNKPLPEWGLTEFTLDVQAQHPSPNCFKLHAFIKLDWITGGKNGKKINKSLVSNCVAPII